MQHFLRGNFSLELLLTVLTEICLQRSKCILHLLTYYLWCTYYIFAKGCSRAQSFTSSSLRADLRHCINRVLHCSLEGIPRLTE